MNTSPLSATRGDSTLRAAANLALQVASSGPSPSPNPRVGCVIWDDATPPFTSGYHLGAGKVHAEIEALNSARSRGLATRGANVVVTLEPCAKSGRTPPCTEALLAAGVGRVFYLAADPTGFGGGAEALRAAGVEVFGPRDLGKALSPELELARRLLTPWRTAVRSERPHVIAKLATTLDGRSAAADGSSRWITGEAARRHAHLVRAQIDGLVVGTRTVVIDDPSLTARTSSGELARQQPRRIIIGRSDIPADAKVHGVGGELITLQTRDIRSALSELFTRGLRQVVVEGGPRLLAEFLRANVVDEIHHYLAPALLGAGRNSVEDFGVETIDQISRWHRHALLDLQPDLLQVLTRSATALPSAVPDTWCPDLALEDSPALTPETLTLAPTELQD